MIAILTMQVQSVRSSVQLVYFWVLLQDKCFNNNTTQNLKEKTSKRQIQPR